MSLRHGVNLQDFVFLAVITGPLLLGAMEFGWYVALRIGVERCVRVATRAAADVCNPSNCDAHLGGECTMCPNPPGVVPEEVAVVRFDQCWLETGYPGTPSLELRRTGSSAARNRRATVTGSVTYTPFAATSGLPNPITTTITMRFDDQTL